MEGQGQQRLAPRHLADYLLSVGRPNVDLAEAAQLMGLAPPAGADALMRLRRAGQFFSPGPGLYVAVPPEYRSWGAVPAMDFINFLMTANERRYYVSLLSAAELYGAAHQRPQVFQVMVDRSFEDRSFGRVRLQFYSRANLNAVPVKLVNSRVDQVRVSTPAATCLDLATRPLDSGGLSNVATVLSELVAEQTVSAEQLVDAAQAFPAASLRRLGWLLDHVDAALDRDKLAAILSNRSSGRATALLDPKGVRRGSGTNRWNVVVNSEVEADL